MSNDSPCALYFSIALLSVEISGGGEGRPEVDCERATGDSGNQRMAGRKAVKQSVVDSIDSKLANRVVEERHGFLLKLTFR